MSKRLQVVFADAELREIRAVARRRRMTVAEWVRQSLRAARVQEPGKSARHKLTALREAVRHEGPTADIAEMLAEIERG
jgi:hypothetical protein